MIDFRVVCVALEGNVRFADTADYEKVAVDERRGTEVYVKG